MSIITLFVIHVYSVWLLRPAGNKQSLESGTVASKNLEIPPPEGDTIPNVYKHNSCLTQTSP